MLKVSNLSLQRGSRQLFKDLSFGLAGGQVLQIRGSNGSGKSSLAAVIAGDLRADSGEVLFNDRKDLSIIELSRMRGVLLQELEIDFPISVQDYVQLGNSFKKPEEVLNRLNLQEISTNKITELSFGQLQRVEMAQLLLQDPQLFILDEPFSAQDQINTKLFKELFWELKKSEKMIILINHIDFDLEGLVDQVVDLDLFK